MEPNKSLQQSNPDQIVDVDLNLVQLSAERYSPAKVLERLQKITGEFKTINGFVYGGLSEARTHGVIKDFPNGQEDTALLEVIDGLNLVQRTKVAEIIADMRFGLHGVDKPAVNGISTIADAGEELERLLFPTLPRYTKRAH